MIWREFERAAPELARLGRERFERTHVALIATLRIDGSPRISPIEPVFAMGHLLLGAMESPTARDLRRDARCALHSSVSDINGCEGEFKLHGRAEPVDAETRAGDYDAWWNQFPPDRATVFYMKLESAPFVAWDTAAGVLDVTSWSRIRGVKTDRRSYP